MHKGSPVKEDLRIRQLEEELRRTRQQLEEQLETLELRNELVLRINRVLDRKLLELNIIKEVNESTSSLQDYKQTVKSVLLMLSKVIDYQVAALLLRDAKQLILYLNQPTSEAFLHTFKGQVADALAQCSGETSSPPNLAVEIYNETLIQSGPRKNDAELKALLCQPLRTMGEVKGILAIGSEASSGFSREDLNILTIIGSQAITLIGNAKLYRDVAEFNKALQSTTERLAAERSKTQSLVESMTDGVLLLNREGRMTVINPQGREYLTCFAMWGAGDLLTHFGNRPIGELVDDVLNGSQREMRRELNAIDGSNRVFEVVISPVKLQKEEIDGAVMVLRDVTRERDLREQVLQADKLSSVGQLVSSVAHELNSPLTGVMGFSELMLMSAECSEKMKRFLQKINAEAHRAKKIVQNLLTFARKHKPEKEYVDINGIIEKALELRAYDMGLSNIEVIKELNEKLPMTMADPHQLQQVFLNIINNAYEAMLGTKRPCRLTVKTGRVGEMIRVVFADAGPGIPKEHLAKIFDPFYTTKEVDGGTGLGLSISYGIVQEHGGKIYAASQEGEGAIFTIELPVVEGYSGGGSEVAETKQSIAGHRKILVVDDDKPIIDLMEEFFRQNGHRVDSATDGGAALQKIEREDYHVIIADLKMPGMNGQQLVAELKAKRAHLLKRFIIMTGDTVNPETRAFFERSGVHFLGKPFAFEQLNTLVRKVLETVP